MPLKQWLTHKKLLLWPVGTLYFLVSFHSIAFQVVLKITVDSLLGTGEVNGLDSTGLLELRGNSRLGSSGDASAHRRDEGALLSRSSNQLPGGLAESAGYRS